MSTHVGRNDQCPCGSGKKLKSCHPSGYAAPSKNRNVMIIGIGVAVVAIAAVAMLQQDSTVPLQAGPARPMTAPASKAPTRNAAMPASQGAGTPQPGPAPPGKVWSAEHGHWHDEPGATAANQGVQVMPAQGQPLQLPAGQTTNQTAKANIPEPAGAPPTGKVWSPEHGHYHDAPKTPPAAPATKTGPN